MKTLCVMLCVLLSLTLVVQSAAPPEKGHELTEEEKKEVARLERGLDRKLNAGEFEEAVKAAHHIADYRAQRQGDSHWEVVDARWRVTTWQRPVKDCVELKRSYAVDFEGRQLQQKLRYREAEAKLREALAIRQKILGEQHPATAASYSNVGCYLYEQGKHVEALPLSRKALAISQQVLGEQHPETANCYNNVGFCLAAQGEHAEAL